jgi:catechol 2,3-dioxygenase-like lactoylglutathione lyase family enzyme
VSGPTPFERVVRLAVVVLCASALFLVIVIGTGTELDETGGRLIGTAALLALCCLAGVAGTSLAARRPEWALLGYLTALAAAATFVATEFGIWSDDPGEGTWEAAGMLAVLGVAGAHTSLLLASARDRDPDPVRVVRAGTILVIWLLSLVAIAEISGNGDIGERPLGILAVLYVLGVLVLPLLRRIAPDEGLPPAPASADAGRVAGIDHVVIAVGDRRRSDLFYVGVLGAELVPTSATQVAYRIGGQQIDVHEASAQPSPVAADPVRPGNSDLCLLWAGPIEAALRHLGERGVEVVAGPVGRTGGRGPGQSLYVRDPDGSLIELICYES